MFVLRIYVESENLDRCDHAMESLINAMRWDEERFDLEYDLDIYHIVATNDFNMGAMENKSLNIFNSKYVLARPDTATDADYQGIEGVIGHEYFHNWTGNRVTCRDWFELTLKEGLTVFRDEEFSADMQSRAVKRIRMSVISEAGSFLKMMVPCHTRYGLTSMLKSITFTLQPSIRKARRSFACTTRCWEKRLPERYEAVF